MRYLTVVIGSIVVWGCQAVEISPPKRDFALVIAKARELYRSGEFQKAIEIVNGILQVDPQNSSVHELNGDILVDMGEYRKAIASFQKAVNIAPRAYSAYLKEGFAHEFIKEEKKAIYCLRKGIKIYRNLPHGKAVQKEDSHLAKRAVRRFLKFMPPIKIAVLYFEGDYETTANNYNRYIPVQLIKRLKEKKHFQVKDPRGQSKFLEKFSLGLKARPEQSQRIGRLLQVDWVIMVAVYHTADSYQIGLKVLQVSTGAITYEDTIGFSSHKDAEARCDEIADKIVIYTI